MKRFHRHAQPLGRPVGRSLDEHRGEHADHAADASLLRVSDLTAGYGPVAVVRDVGFHIDAGEIVCLLGPNGAGKTTTLAALAGLLPAASGSILFDGRHIDRWTASERARSGLVLVPQDRGLFMRLTTLENLLLRTRGKRDERIEAALTFFPALAPLLSRRVALLSGGEQQMLAIAAAVCARPRLLLLDEMSLGLAPIIVSGLLRELRGLTRSSGLAVLLVEQHVDQALSVADRAYVMTRGALVSAGSTAELRSASGQLANSYLGTGRSPASSQSAVADRSATRTVENHRTTGNHREPTDQPQRN